MHLVSKEKAHELWMMIIIHTQFNGLVLPIQEIQYPLQPLIFKYILYIRCLTQKKQQIFIITYKHLPTTKRTKTNSSDIWIWIELHWMGCVRVTVAQQIHNERNQLNKWMDQAHTHTHTPRIHYYRWYNKKKSAPAKWFLVYFFHNLFIY